MRASAARDVRDPCWASAKSGAAPRRRRGVAGPRRLRGAALTGAAHVGIQRSGGLGSIEAHAAYRAARPGKRALAWQLYSSLMLVMRITSAMRLVSSVKWRTISSGLCGVKATLMDSSPAFISAVLAISTILALSL